MIPARERLVELVASAQMPTSFGNFRAVAYRNILDGTEHLALVLGDVAAAGHSEAGALVRVHSECLTGDILGSLRCDCGAQLEQALRAIADEGCGAVVYLRGHEGRGIGLAHKIRAYAVPLPQDYGDDTELRFTASYSGVGQAVIDTQVDQRQNVRLNRQVQAMLKAFFPKLTPKPFDNADAMLEALKSHQVDAVFADGLRLPFWVAGEASANCCALFDGPYLSEKFLGEGVAVMLAKSDPLLPAAFDQALSVLSRNGRLQDIYLRYFPHGLY